MRQTTWFPMVLLICWSVGVAASQARSDQPPSPPAASGGGHSGLPVPRAILLADEARVPFVLPESFPVPVVEVRLNGTGPWRLAVDTAMGGTVLLRKDLVSQMGLPIVGQAMVGDSSGRNARPAELVRIDSMRLGEMDVRDIVGIGFAAGEAHLSQIPDDIHGILGNRIYAELVMTLDYSSQAITFRAAALPADESSVVPFESVGNVMVVEMDLAGRRVPLIVDSGSRGSITLPSSMAAELPLIGTPVEIDPVSTVSNTYRRRAARLDGQARLAGSTVISPEIEFAEEHTPKLIGYRMLKHFILTIDQAHGRLRWEKAR